MDFLSISWFFSSIYAFNLIRILFASNFIESARTNLLVINNLVFNLRKVKYIDIFVIIFLTILVLIGYNTMASPYYISLFSYGLN